MAIQSREKLFDRGITAFILLITGLITFFILDSSLRGIDISDEGFYLLSASVTDSKSSFHNPFGDYTGLLLKLAFNQVWLFRWFGVLLLVTAGGVLGYKLFQLGHNQSRVRKLQYISVGFTVGPFYFATGLISPSYNWLNLLALVLGGISCIQITKGLKIDKPAASKLALQAVAACWLGAFAKASSGPGIGLLILLALVLTRRNRMEYARIVFFGFLYFIMFLVWHITVINSISMTFEKFRRGRENMLLFDPNYSIERALDSFIWGLKEWAFKTLIQFPLITFLLALMFILSFVGLLIERFGRQNFHLSLFIQVTSSVALVVYFIYAFIDGLWAGYPERYINQMWAVSGVLLISLATFMSNKLNCKEWPKHSDVFPVIVLVALAVLYAFGSGNGFISQLSGASGLIALASFHLLASVAKRRRVSTSIATIILLLGGLQVTREALQNPYRQPPRSAQKYALEVRNGFGSVYVDIQMKQLVQELRLQMTANGWKENTRLLDLTKYSAGLVFMLGAKPPLTIIPTVGGYPTVNQVAEWSIAQALIVDPGWKAAWLLLPKNVEDSTEDGRPSPDVLWVLDQSFPIDYVMVAESFGFTVWKPIRE